MKTKTITLFFTICLTGVFQCFSQNSPIGEQAGRGRTYVAPYIGDQTVTIDAKADEPFWASSPFAEMDTVVAGTMKETPLTAEDFTGKFKLAWDDNNFYIYVTAVDDVIIGPGKGIGFDNIEIFFHTDSLWYTREYNDSEEDQWNDPYNSTKGFTASQIRVNVLNQFDMDGQGYAKTSGSALLNYAFHSTETDNGFDMEIKVPYEMIINPDKLHTFDPTEGEGQVLYFDIGYGDVDVDNADATREHIVHWNATSPNAFKDVRHFAKVVLGNEGGGTSTNDFSTEKVKVYPTFTSGKITVELPDYQQCKSISITSIIGQRVLYTPVTNMTNHFDIQNLPAGIYLLSVEKSNGMISTSKIIKQK